MTLMGSQTPDFCFLLGDPLVFYRSNLLPEFTRELAKWCS